MEHKTPLTIDGQTVPFEPGENLLATIRRAGIDIPTFCYHSELSVYGACRLCVVDVQGRGVVASCSTPTEPGLVVRTNTGEIRNLRRISLELTLARHDGDCMTCPKANCKLQELSHRLGVRTVRFPKVAPDTVPDTSSSALIRDPGKCILCGDCVRVCEEIQGVGAIHFAGRGHEVQVTPAFNETLGSVECVDCGQCAAICPVGAITVKRSIDPVWEALEDEDTVVVAQIAPAVRVAIGEGFGLEAGSCSTGQIVASLRKLGFDYIFDTAFGADMTVLEEGEEFFRRMASGEHLPQFTSCCPAWVKFAEFHYPELLPHLSSCRSPQQMMGALVKERMGDRLLKGKKKMVMVSIMPCSAKKDEALLAKFRDPRTREPHVDFVLTTAELESMIREGGIDLASLPPRSMDMPLGFKTGAGVLFGASGGVTEAVLRYACEKLRDTRMAGDEFPMIRGEEGIRTAELTLGDTTMRVAVVHGLKNARTVADQVRAGTSPYDLVEVMACPGGCVGGAGQPGACNGAALQKRRDGLFTVDRTLQLHKSQDNHNLTELYQSTLGEVGGHTAHELLHTAFTSRKRSRGSGIVLDDAEAPPVEIHVCVGTNCYLRGAQDLLVDIIKYTSARGITTQVGTSAHFCFERCNRGPVVSVNGEIREQCTLAEAIALIEAQAAQVLHTEDRG